MTSRTEHDRSTLVAVAPPHVRDRNFGRSCVWNSSTFTLLTIVLIATACDAPTAKAPTTPPPTAPAPAPTPTEPVTTEPKQVGEFAITLYYVAEEAAFPKHREVAVGSEDESASVELASITPPSDHVTLYSSPSCEPIAEVTKEFASHLELQGTGKLRDGRVLNVWGQCRCPNTPCFKVTSTQWGTAGTGRPLQPFRTVAVDPKLVKLGSLLYIPLLEGRTMPGRPPFGGFVHDGCVVADDTGGGIKGQQIDLFVGRRAYFNGMSRSGSPGPHSWASKVPVFDGSKLCERSGRKVGRKTGAI